MAAGHGATVPAVTGDGGRNVVVGVVGGGGGGGGDSAYDRRRDGNRHARARDNRVTQRRNTSVGARQTRVRATIVGGTCTFACERKWCRTGAGDKIIDCAVRPPVARGWRGKRESRDAAAAVGRRCERSDLLRGVGNLGGDRWPAGDPA